jgi:hypothetical protein
VAGDSRKDNIHFDSDWFRKKLFGQTDLDKARFLAFCGHYPDYGQYNYSKEMVLEARRPPSTSLQLL